MLVLRRNLRQRIIITVRGERIAIDLVAVGPNWARIGVEAAKEVEIWREEIQPANDAK